MSTWYRAGDVIEFFGLGVLKRIEVTVVLANKTYRVQGHGKEDCTEYELDALVSRGRLVRDRNTTLLVAIHDSLREILAKLEKMP